MSEGKAMIRELIERVEGVSRTWFELEIEGSSRKKILVAEVNFDLDANSAHHLRAACDEIEKAFATIISEQNSDRVSKLRIVNRSSQANDKTTDHSSSGQQSAKPTKNATGEQRERSSASPT